MKRIVFIFLTVLFLGGCNSKSKQTDSKPIVTVSILPQKYFVEQIAGKMLDVNVMVPPGASPADYEPKPRQVTALNNSLFYFFIGHLGFEKSWINKLADNAPDVEFVSCSNGLDLLEAGCTHQGHGNHVHSHGTDPHIWTSPENVKTISETIYRALSRKFPDYEEEFRKNMDLFTQKIEKLDNSIRKEFFDDPGGSFMIFHPALGYFARDYYLKQYSIEFEGKSPSAKHLKNMIDLAKRDSISTIFVQSQFETGKAKTVASEIDARVVEINPLNEDWMAEMYALKEKMVKAVKQ